MADEKVSSISQARTLEGVSFKSVGEGSVTKRQGGVDNKADR